jgi:zinc protease
LVATSHLSDRLFEEVRTKRNLTYAVSVGHQLRRSNVGYLYTTTVKPNETVQVIYQEIDRLQAQPISAKELNDQVQVFLTEHFMRQETVSAQAGALVSYENVGGGWEQSLVFLDRIKAVTPEEIQRVSKTYLTQIHWAYLGKPEAADAALLGSK